MKALPQFLSLLALSVSLSAESAESSALDRLADRLTFSNAERTTRLKISGLLDLEGHAFEQPAPGLVFSTGHALFNPRLTLFADAQHADFFYAFAQGRLDRGFDPAPARARARLDEYALRFTSRGETPVSLQLGKSSSLVGQWSKRHLSWDNPFVNAPLAYESLTSIDDAEAPAGADEFSEPFPSEEKYEYVPLVWGPGYSTGATLAAILGSFTLAAEIKNAGPSARPEAWDLSAVDFSAPAYNARLAWRPGLPWEFGFTASDSAYFLPQADLAAAPHGYGHYRQRLLAQDISYAWRHFQLWAEFFQSSFDVPRVGQVHAYSGYLELRYKFAARFSGALRVNLQRYSRVTLADGSRRPWTPELARLDLAGCYRFTPHVQLKIQTSIEDTAGDGEPVRLNHAAQFTLRF